MPTRADYRPPACDAGEVALWFDLDARETRVRAECSFRRNPAAAPGEPLVLHWRDMEIASLTVDGVAQAVGGRSGELAVVPRGETLTVSAEVVLDPAANTSLQGLYPAGAALVTHCEPEGFRRIIPFPDRPDVLVRMTATLAGSRADFPVLLSNGEREAEGAAPGGRHWVRWRDPVPKPCYLFALAAGPFETIEDRHVTRSGRTIALAAHVLNGPAERARFALDCLRSVMAWEERRLGREYDLDTYNIAVFSPLAFHAMENKGLNFFDESVGLVDPETATDLDRLGVEINVAHEYLHHWTGNRVPCRDWFELCLKEGLTTLRHQLYAEERHGPAMRLWPLRVFRTQQLPEDLGPSARPARPPEYAEPFNLYTPTAYIKSAEIFRMISELTGAEGFARGLNRFLDACDGRPARIEDALREIGAGAGVDLGGFLAWFETPGALAVAAEPLAEDVLGRPGMAVRRAGGAGDSRPLPLGRMDPDVEQVDAEVGEQTRIGGVPVLHGRSAELRWPADGRAAPMLFDGVSAPVILRERRGDAALAAAMTGGGDPCRRWDASQQLATRAIAAVLAGAAAEDAAHGLAGALGEVLARAADDPAMAAELIALPEPRALLEPLDFPDPEALHAAWSAVRGALGGMLDGALQRARAAVPAPPPDSHGPAAIGARALGNAALELWLAGGGAAAEAAARAQFAAAQSPNQEVAALRMLTRTHGGPDPALAETARRRWERRPALLRRWFEIQALRPAADTAETVRTLLRDPAFDAGDVAQARSLCSAFFVHNLRGFHDSGGGGYALLGEVLRDLDARNPVVAAWLLRSTDLGNWRRFAGPRGEAMRALLDGLAGACSAALADIVGRFLE
ncbi:aminopeptidase N C-terminal domain-containing protein [Sphingomonas canadensis]|uniref:Aminopeptidase N n=1 Tax=Sphingomonas canadensis TaxID=1219257 RepID=A0ABW3H7D2_9SPHN|nr:aminopeptidase N C-terminal domain-containing protein [Sphingomonas canadensis]MCW3836944.1 aminopeptidase N C-terminal domain-containing protein [Sphingomonas canadensis]